MANLPNKSFVFNYNARDYDASTFTIPNDSGGTLQRDMVWTATTSTIRDNIQLVDDHLAIPESATSIFTFASSGANPMNYTSINDVDLTVVFKAKYSGTGTNRGTFLASQKVSNGGVANWMVRIGSREYNPASDTRISFVVGATQSNWDNAIPYTCGDTITAAVRTQKSGSSIGVSINRLDVPASTSFTNNYTNVYGSENIFFFNIPYFQGDFYWCYASREVLTDEEIQQVIAFNESKFGPDSTGTTIAASGGTATTNLEAETGWTATTTSPWITISPASGESGTTAITFTIRKNNFAPRTGVVVFTDDNGDTAEYTINQEGQDKVAPINKMYQGTRRIN